MDKETEEYFNTYFNLFRNDGWKVLVERQEKDTYLPKLVKGQNLLCERSEVVEKNTQPPAYFTDATLLAAMSNIARFVKDVNLKTVLKETDGLGTEATRAGIIELLFKRQFLKRTGKIIQATEVGRKLIQSLPECLTLPDMTAQWEMQLNAISEKKQSYNGFVLPLQKQLTDIIAQAIIDGPHENFLKHLKCHHSSHCHCSSNHRSTVERY